MRPYQVQTAPCGIPVPSTTCTCNSTDAKDTKDKVFAWACTALTVARTDTMPTNALKVRPYCLTHRADHLPQGMVDTADLPFLSSMQHVRGMLALI